MNEIFLKRLCDNGRATLGMVYFPSGFFCFSLEDEFRKVKVSGETRIPAGSYRLEKCFQSGLLNRMRANGWYTFDWIPTICDVPGFKNIRMHNGANEHHTDGCPLVGFVADGKSFTLGRSRECMLEFVERLETCFNEGAVYITIYDERKDNE